MDSVLTLLDSNLLTPYVYPSNWATDFIPRQFLSLLFLVTFSGYFLYFVTATLNYLFIFDHRLKEHPLFLKNQIWKEIKVTCQGIPLMSFLSCCCFLLEVRGHSKLLNSVHESSLGWFSIALSVITFILFTDCAIYFIHRRLHHPLFYKRLHKVHHLWKVPSPFASHAFHPVDGFLQSLPYHLYVFMWPMNKFAYLGLFFLVNIWTVSIHDGDFRVPKVLKPIVNGAAHHTDHHLFYNFNYGQFFTLWDRLGGSFREPSSFQKGHSPLEQVLLRKGIDEGLEKNK